MIIQQALSLSDAKKSAAAALEALVAGNRRFLRGLQLECVNDSTRREELRAGQQPKAIVLTCADSRVPPELIFDQGFGDLFVIRVAGNVVSDHVLGSISYALQNLGTRLVLVLGHTGCGAVKAAVAEFVEKAKQNTGVQDSAAGSDASGWEELSSLGTPVVEEELNGAAASSSQGGTVGHPSPGPSASGSAAGERDGLGTPGGAGRGAGRAGVPIHSAPASFDVPRGMPAVPSPKGPPRLSLDIPRPGLSLAADGKGGSNGGIGGSSARGGIPLRRGIKGLVQKLWGLLGGREATEKLVRTASFRDLEHLDNPVNAIVRDILPAVRQVVWEVLGESDPALSPSMGLTPSSSLSPRPPRDSADCSSADPQGAPSVVAAAAAAAAARAAAAGGVSAPRPGGSGRGGGAAAAQASIDLLGSSPSISGLVEKMKQPLLNRPSVNNEELYRRLGQSDHIQLDNHILNCSNVLNEAAYQNVRRQCSKVWDAMQRYIERPAASELLMVQAVYDLDSGSVDFFGLHG